MTKIISLLFCIFLQVQALAMEASDQLQNTVQPPTFADIVEPLIPTVVNIYTEQEIRKDKEQFNSPFGDFKELFKEFEMPFLFEDIYSNPRAVSLGSGFIIDKTGYIVTNSHVVENAKKINIKLHDGSEVEAKLVGFDKKTDLALLKIDVKKDLEFAAFGDDRKTRVGDWVIAIGNPFGLNHTVTKGIISSKARDIDLESDGIVNNYVQTDAPINRGNSGGPMFNLNGQVIGVNTSIYSTSGSNAGVGFAIPSQTVQKVVEQLQKFGKVNRGLLNIVIQPITNEIGEGLGLKDEKGVLVTEVLPNGTGDKAGLKAGDVILKINDKKVSSPREVQVLVGEAEVNSSLKILVLRGKEKKELSGVITIDASADEKSFSQKNEKDSLAQSGKEINGVTFSDTSDANIAKYQIDPKLQGVVVTGVYKSSSWRHHIKVGDIVTSINQEVVSTVKDVIKIYESIKEKKKNIIFIKIQRGSSSVFLALPTPREHNRD